MPQPVRIAILGATGTVGQKLVHLLRDHPWFEVSEVAASPRSAGRRYAEAVHWLEPGSPPESVADLEVKLVTDDLDCDLAFSALDSSVAREVEPRMAESGIPVVSNASALRMAADVPLIVPEVNADHVDLLKNRKNKRALIVTNPNCAVTGVVMVLKPIYDAFGINAVNLTTLQAISGAGYPGISALDILGDAVPLIVGEEDKLVSEPQKILGRYFQGEIKPAPFTVSAQATRVPVIDGHLLCLSIQLVEPASPEAVRQVIEDFRGATAGLNLPSAPDRPVQVLPDNGPPRPRLHANAGHGMTVTVGRIRKCEIHDIRLVALVHNTVRGAAGAAILNAELLVKKGLVSFETYFE